jgi:L-threonylcarbamoyladenylate synthase
VTQARILPAGRAGSLDEAAALLRAGALVAFPTDTVYGLGAHVFNVEAVAGLYAAKGRAQEKSIPVLLADLDDLAHIVAEVPAAAWKLAHTFWPGALTLVMPRRPELPEAVSAGPGVAVRLPDHPLTRDLIRAAGAPLATTSANRSGEPNTMTAAQVAAVLGDRIAAILDGGDAPGGVPSTVVDCTVLPPRVLRQGAITLEILQAVVPDLV